MDDKPFIKHDNSKPYRPDLLPWDALQEISAILEVGARKYTPDNWRKCEEPMRYFAAMMRHWFKFYVEGEEIDPETGRHHLDHMACNALFIAGLKHKMKPMEKK